MGPAMIMSLLLGTIGGSWIGMKRDSKIEKVGVTFALFARSFPIYLTGIILLNFFSHKIDIFPLGGMRSIGAINTTSFSYFMDITHHLLLPLIVAVIYYAGDVVVIARTSLLELVGEEFLEFAKAQGLGESRIQRIAMRNAIIPIVTYSTVMIGFAFGGQVLLETVFSWPGIGRLMVESVTRHDYPVAQASFFIMALVVIVSNLFVDVLYSYLDPRITYEIK
jgi:peptide/nickel transport system permease protein